MVCLILSIKESLLEDEEPEEPLPQLTPPLIALVLLILVPPLPPMTLICEDSMLLLDEFVK